MRALRARSRPRRPTRPSRVRGATVFLGTCDFAAAVLRAIGEGPHRPALVVTRPDAKQGRGRRLAPPPVAEAARELGIELDQPDSVNDPDAVARIDAVEPEAVVALRLRRAGQGAAAQPATRSSTSTRRCCRAGAARRRSSGRSWPATRRPACRSCAWSPALDAGPVYAQRAEPIAPDDDYGDARRAPAGTSRSTCCASVLDDRPRADAAARGRRHLRREDHRRGPHARPRAPRARERRRRPRAAPAHRRADRAAPTASFVGVHEARVGDDGGLRAARRPARRRAADALRRLPARAPADRVARRRRREPGPPGCPVAEPALVGARPRGLRPRRSGRRCGPGSSGRARPRRPSRRSAPAPSPASRPRRCRGGSSARRAAGSSPPPSISVRQRSRVRSPPLIADTGRRTCS